MDVETGAPVPGAVVDVDGATAGVTPQGAATFMRLPGRYRVLASAAGYQDAGLWTTVGGQPHHVEVLLVPLREPAPAPEPEPLPEPEPEPEPPPRPEPRPAPEPRPRPEPEPEPEPEPSPEPEPAPAPEPEPMVGAPEPEPVSDERLEAVTEMLHQLADLTLRASEIRKTLEKMGLGESARAAMGEPTLTEAPPALPPEPEAPEPEPEPEGPSELVVLIRDPTTGEGVEGVQVAVTADVDGESSMVAQAVTDGDGLAVFQVDPGSYVVVAEAYELGVAEVPVEVPRADPLVIDMEPEEPAEPEEPEEPDVPDKEVYLLRGSAFYIPRMKPRDAYETLLEEWRRAGMGLTKDQTDSGDYMSRYAPDAVVFGSEVDVGMEVPQRALVSPSAFAKWADENGYEDGLSIRVESMTPRPGQDKVAKPLWRSRVADQRGLGETEDE
jgi:hypothetical protein